VTAAAPPISAGGPPGAAPAAESCPLCGAPLRPDQEWCLKCGAAARTRLAAAPNWRAPLVTLAVIGALALAILAAALVKLAGDSGPAPPARTMTVTTAQPAAAAPASTLPASTTAQGAVPGAGLAGPAATRGSAAPSTTPLVAGSASVLAARRHKHRALLDR
jgi:hypothetical protein